MGLISRFMTTKGPLKSAHCLVLSNATTKTLTLDATANATVVDALTEGMTVRVDNSWFLALHSFHRHQIPSRAGFYGFDQFRDAKGDPIYPQRKTETGPQLVSKASGGGTHTGNITGKIIVVDNLLDSDAYPWHADWYKHQVKKALGSDFENSYRLWYNEYANHDFGPVLPKKLETQLVEFGGIYEQALRDLAQWVENETLPPASTTYTVTNSQIEIPQDAGRGGIQAVLCLKANGTERLETVTGAPVIFDVNIQVPKGTGKVVSVEWDHLGVGEFVPQSFGLPRETLSIRVNYRYRMAGTYFPAVRVTSQREGNQTTPFGRIHNLGRARVVVSEHTL
jgi:hypothetical protein